MKRTILLLLAIGLLSSAASALTATRLLTPIAHMELASTTAGICTTCNTDSVPPPKQVPTSVESWELVSQKQSAAVLVKRKPEITYRNSTSNPMTLTHDYSDNCTRIVTGGSVSFLRGIGVTLNSTLHCAEIRTANFIVPPRETVTIYRGTKRYYVTSTYRLVLTWSNGIRETTGRTETMREEFTYDYMEAN